MIGFLIGLVVALVAAVGVYYVIVMQAPKDEERGASTQLQINLPGTRQGE